MPRRKTLNEAASDWGKEIDDLEDAESPDDRITKLGKLLDVNPDNLTVSELFRFYRRERVSLLGAIRMCTDPSNRAYKWYGARGIVVSPRWKGTEGFRRFLNHVGPRPVGAVLGRIDGTKGYVPGNVAWTTLRKAQEKRANTHMITMYGMKAPAAEWARRYGHTRQTITNRIARGWHPHVAIKTPAGANKMEAHKAAGISPKYDTVRTGGHPKEKTK